MLEKINADLQNAMKNGDKFRLSVIRMVKSDIIAESRKGKIHDLTDEEILSLIKRGVKSRKEAILEYEKYGKEETVLSLKEEIKILQEYLPEELSEEEIKKELDEIFAIEKPEGIKDMGKIMKIASSKLKNADMSLVSKLIKERLS